MFNEDFDSFFKESSLFRTIPIVKRFNVDTLTPIQIFKSLEDEAVYLLESKDDESSWSRYSFIGLDPFYTIKESNNTLEVLENESAKFESESLRSVMSWIDAELKVSLPDISIPFAGGAVGYIGYEAIHMFEPSVSVKQSDRKKCHLFICSTMLAFDHQEKALYMIKYVRLQDKDTKEMIRQKYENGIAEINRILSKMQAGKKVDDLLLPIMERNKVDFSLATSNYEKETFLQDVEKVKEYIRSGDIFQGVLSQRFQIPITISGFDLYRILRTINPSPYLFYIKTDETELVGSSPERLIHIQNGHLEIHPIAGTRRRGRTSEEDEELAKDLSQDDKEIAEHVMLVDLARNDIGKVAEYGSVSVPLKQKLVRFSHVMHLISKVTGRLKDSYHPVDALLSSFPAGTVSGAPKIRAMQILQELEPTARDEYAGCVAYIGFDGNIDSCITIRTMVIRNQTAYVQAGAGIVADSVPELEWKETRNKASALIYAIQIAEQVFSKREVKA
ncbi:anthranilate synthase component I [Metabacillus arenae]|uniref:Anthranilate synthase component 1 n=1 Tax=Metabacillus arenae TaxID=2771434 RepID=A0A926NEN1_9BACI|nr:anthranilate synthase component I [Metabacillus arenae]MBD1378608.1 anthranilate synthase component I [Metabacillus arenae]